MIPKKTYDQANYDEKIGLIYGIKKTCHRCKKICDDSIPISIEGDIKQYYICKDCDKLMGWEDE